MPNPIYRCARYTPEESAYLRANWAIKSSAALARELGRTPNAVVVQACRMGLKKRPTLAANEAELRRLHALGRTDHQIGAALGVTHDTVFEWRKLLGLPAAVTSAERGRMGIEKQNAMARGQGAASWTHYVYERRRVRCEYAFPGCRTPTQVRVCQALALAPGESVGWRFLSERVGLCKSVVLIALRRLIEAGAVAKERRGRRASFRLAGRALRFARSGPASAAGVVGSGCDLGPILEATR